MDERNGSRMLCEQLKIWQVLHPEEKCILIFHTSALTLSEGDLEQVAKELPYQWVFPENVYHEIAMLKESNIFGRQADRILKLSRMSRGVVMYSNLEDFYGSQKYLRIRSFMDYKKIFVFGSQLKMKEFLEKVPEKDDFLIYYHNRWSHFRYDANDTVTTVRQAKKWIGLLDCVKKQKYMGTATSVNTIKNIKEVDALDSNGNVKAHYHVGDKLGSGGEADIYEACENPCILLKIYRYPISGNRLKKLQILTGYIPPAKRKSKMPYVKLPLFLLYSGGVPVGIAMEKVTGKSLEDQMADESLDPVALLQELALKLLELNLLHLVVVDLAEPNLMLDSQNRLYLVDTDSFQAGYYGSGVYIREQYMHRELVGKKGCVLYDFRYQDFAFAVLAFKLLVCGSFSPLYQAGAYEASEEGKLFWGGEFEFPYVLPGETQKKVNETCREAWEMMPLVLKKAFVEEFHFEREYSIGHWLKLLVEAQQ